MTRDHKFYEMQAALAAAGQLDDAELLELEQHAAGCASCHKCIAEMAEMSREFFLVQAQRTNGKWVPAGAQERFLERAIRAGIPVSPSTSTLFDPRFARVAAILILLAISTSLSWNVLSVPNVERAATSDSSKSENRPTLPLESTARVVTEQLAQVASTSEAQRRKRSIARRRAVSISAGHGITGDRPSYFELNRHLFPMDVRAGPSFSKAYAASFFGLKEDSKPEQRTFHLDHKLVSLSFLDVPPSVDPDSPITRLTFDASAFHLDPNRVW